MAVEKAEGPEGGRLRRWDGKLELHAAGAGDSLQENSRQRLSYILPTAARGTP